MNSALQLEIAALAAMPDEEIDTADIPEVTDWSGATRPNLASADELEWLAEMAAANGYVRPVPMGDGKYACLCIFAFTYGIITGRMFNDWTYEDRWCYEHPYVAHKALEEWQERHFEGEPIGWHRHPDSGRRRPDGDPSKEYINP
jgi:hypothetical protein